MCMRARVLTGMLPFAPSFCAVHQSSSCSKISKMSPFLKLSSSSSVAVKSHNACAWTPLGSLGFGLSMALVRATRALLCHLRGSRHGHRHGAFRCKRVRCEKKHHRHQPPTLTSGGGTRCWRRRDLWRCGGLWGRSRLSSGRFRHHRRRRFRHAGAGTTATAGAVVAGWRVGVVIVVVVVNSNGRCGRRALGVGGLDVGLDFVDVVLGGFFGFDGVAAGGARGRHRNDAAMTNAGVGIDATERIAHRAQRQQSGLQVETW